MLYDITRTIGRDTLTYPGDAALAIDHAKSIARGDTYNYTQLHLSAHCGTHLDAPCHFIADGAAIAELPLERFRPSAHVVDTGAARVITAELLAGLELAPGEAVLFKTANALLPRDGFSPEYTYLDVEAARLLAGRGAGLVGIDYLSVDRYGDKHVPVHYILLGAGALIMEEADLRAVPPGRYRLYCFPLRLHETEASPVRAVLEEL
jgi:arylformamidase